LIQSIGGASRAHADRNRRAVPAPRIWSLPVTASQEGANQLKARQPQPKQRRQGDRYQPAHTFERRQNLDRHAQGRERHRHSNLRKTINSAHTEKGNHFRLADPLGPERALQAFLRRIIEDQQVRFLGDIVPGSIRRRLNQVFGNRRVVPLQLGDPKSGLCYCSARNFPEKLVVVGI
jgi:hypothetical protein